MNRVFALLVIVAAMPRSAAAQWHIGAYVGAASTQAAAITLRATTPGASTRVDHVTFRGRPFDAPIYYGYRFGRDLGRRGLGLEGELIHLKVIANEASLAPPLEAFAMTHGMNFMLVNLVWSAGDDRQAVRWVARAGAGPTLPHAESRVAGQAREGYEWGGLGVQLAPGLTVRLTRRLSVAGEYKFTAARPAVAVAGGTVTTSIRSHHLALGMAANW